LTHRVSTVGTAQHSNVNNAKNIQDFVTLIFNNYLQLYLFITARFKRRKIQEQKHTLYIIVSGNCLNIKKNNSFLKLKSLLFNILLL